MSEAKPKIIFLDIDGVLNHYETKTRFQGFIGVDPSRVKLLNEILKKTGAKLVFSSTWRCFPERANVLAHFREQGFEAEFIGETARRFSSSRRSDEIKRWLQDHEGEYSKYVVLDDNVDAKEGLNVVQTEFWHPSNAELCGLTPTHVEAAIKALAD
jgi:FMN phosphatase YigB (HAD superfamily)